MSDSLLRRSFLSGSAFGVISSAKRRANVGEIARWNFAGSGTTAEDGATGIQNAICSRTCEPDFVDGIAGHALRRDGYSVWLSRPASRAPRLLREFTIQLWTALESYPVSDAAFINRQNRQDSGYFFGLDRYGFWRLEVSVDGVWRKCVSPEPVPRFKWVYLAASFDTAGVITLSQDGLKISTATGRSGTVRQADNVDLLVGKTNGCPHVNGLFATGVLNSLVNQVVIHDRSLPPQAIQRALGRGSRSAEPDLIAVSGEFNRDPHWAAFHPRPPRAWTNEPHGLIRFKGKYHLFYQKNANGPYWGQIDWGHMVSADLLRWAHVKPALSPSPGLDAAGCWSGSVIEHKGQPAIVYTAGDGKKPSICLATSDDGVSFSKSPHNPIVAFSPEELNHPDFRDPFVWAEGNSLYMIIGSGMPDVGGTALLYKSTDLGQWTFLRQLLQGNQENSGTFWEMPVFFSLGEKYILIVTEVPGRSSYWIVNWKDERFYPDHERAERLEILNHFLSPTPFRDDHGRVIVIGIIPETRSSRETWKAGWAHVYSLPRVLSLAEDGSLCQQPAPELQRLRGKHFSLSSTPLRAQQSNLLNDVRGVSLEIAATFRRVDSTRTGFRLRCTADSQEETLLYYDWTKGALTLDRSHSSINPDVTRTTDTGVFPLPPDEPLSLHVRRPLSAGSICKWQRNTKLAYLSHSTGQRWR